MGRFVYLLYVYDSTGKHLDGAFASKYTAESVARAMHLTESEFWIQELELQQ